jgi:hypothetical protein
MLHLTIIGAIIAIAALIIFFSLARTDVRTAFLLDFYANDVAFTIEAMQAVPGDIVIAYPVDEGFQITLDEQESMIRVMHVESAKTDEKGFHLLPGMRVVQSTEESLLYLSKKADVIRLGLDPQASPTVICPLPGVIEADPFAVSVISVHPSSGSLYTVQDLDSFADSLRSHLTIDGVPTSSSAAYAFSIVVSAAPAQNGQSSITIKHPVGSFEDQATYDHLFCELTTRLKPAGIIIRDESTLPGMARELEISFATTPEDKEALFLFGRNELPAAFAEIFTALGKTAVKPSPTPGGTTP